MWSNQWGDKILFSHGSNRSAGVAVLLNNFPGKILTTVRDTCGHWIICVFDIVAGGANDRHSGRGVRPRRGFYSTEIIK